MIQPHELRIGNYVKSITYNEIIQINLIDKYKNYDEKIQPIPITEDELIKLGFEKNKLLVGHLEFEFYGVDNLAIRGMLGTVKPYSIKYVHQLQNIIFALTNKELRYNE